MDTEKTVVIFRKDTKHDDEIIALFPEVPGDSRHWYPCSAYVHLGQHFIADNPWAFVRQTKAAKSNEYAALKKELEQIGYHLSVKAKLSQAMHRVREKEWKKLR